MKKHTTQSGFTLVEMMISIGLFSVVMIFGIGAVLAVNETHRQSQVRRAALDSVNFIMEEISRSARLGDLFRCVSFGPVQASWTIDDPNDLELPANGDKCTVFSFEPYNNISPHDLGDQRIYAIVQTGEDSFSLYKAPESTSSENPITDAYGDWLRLTSDNINIDPNKSGFYIYGARPGDGGQPRVMIRLSGTVVESGGRASTNFSVQTTVSQRLLQVPL